MTRVALLPFPISKEVRALSLPCLACIVAMILPAVIDRPPFLGGVPVFAYLLGAAALGALSIGHEYTGRTLSLLLSLPVGRDRLLLVKLGVLATLLLALWVVADTLLSPGAGGLPMVVPVLCALFLAPCLTMACRNPIAGTVFTIAIQGVLWLLGEWIGVAKYERGREMEAFRIAFLWRATLGLCAIGAVVSWRMFMRLEAIDGPGQDLRLPEWLRRRTTASPAALPFTKPHPMWLLVKKELRLQQMTLIVAGLYLLGWLAVASLRSLVPDADAVFTMLTLPYIGLLALMIGSFASAGERQIGTLEWQVLLPPATSKQWVVKVGVVLGLSMLLAGGLPAVYASLNLAIDPKQLLRPELALAIVLLTAGSLYVSSLCNSGLWALLMSLPVTFVALTFVGVALGRVAASRVRASRLAGVLVTAGLGPGPHALTRVLTLMLIAGFIAVLLRFALTNHRLAEPVAGRVWKHVILMAAFVAAGVMIVAGVEAFQNRSLPFTAELPAQAHHR
jgi:hypothetical protein